jgi:hypothetical protein
MWHDSDLGSEFFALLLEIDRQVAEAVRVAECGCGGRLHRSDYPRKPRGLPESADSAVRRGG